ncbi:ABC transporter substrate-binding protein [Allosalinactinospora lopnorensis]|uniref:ABC transporter substrate-binding protein n=1 Tax=Allosalinactinospora lopnorensis TaxID=1352348 RepID=UPI000623DBAC|nr:ABC transporter substrate-binding protein [Allosalinactinospora lopnorensis]
MTTHAKRWPVAAAALATLLGTACTDYGGDLSGEGGGAGGEDTITVSETAGTPAAFLKYGVQEGYFEAEGLDLQIEASGGGATVIPALISGDIDIAGSNLVSAMIAMGEDMPLRMVAAGTSTSEESEDDFSSLMVPEDSPIEDVEDIEGARIGVNSLQNINDVVIYSALAEHDIEPGGVELVEIPFPDMVPSVERGDVDAGLLIEPFATMGRSEGLRDLMRPYTELQPNLQIGTFLMTEELVGEDPELVSAFQAGVQATADSIHEDPDSFREALPEITDLDPDVAGEVNLPDWQGRSDRESIELIHESMLEYDLTDGAPDFDEVLLY